MQDKSYFCPCDKWRENIDKINAPFLLPMTAIGVYDGALFEYCPWCGEKLIKWEEGNHSIQYNSQCVCGKESFRQSAGGCPVHGANEFGVYE
jgi:hypothetical protein